MAEEKGILATTPQRTTAILQVHFFCVLMVLNGQSGGKKNPSDAVKHTKTLSKYRKARKYKNGGEKHSNLPSSHYLSYNF